MLTGYLYINCYNNTYTTAVCEVCACVRGTGGRVCGGYLFAFAPVMLHVVLMLFQEINKHSYFVFSSHDGAHFNYSMTLVWKLSILTIVVYWVHSKTNAHFISSLWFDTQ